ncbi:LysR family transcriptional regulator [Yoonia sp. BS5-3]|uniref:LysR family transcriptional regulator n=1 Tax=Yoonia phaeophyticola TaxID=3137369 RepID=A0ABZ2V869_9RHOB
MYDWDDYRYILAIAQAKSLPSAAKHLGVAVSTVMRRLDKIQSRSAMPLFEKTAQGYQPTDLGDRLCGIAEDMFAQAMLAEGCLRNATESYEGQLRISGSEVIVPYFLARHIPAIQQSAPGLRVALSVHSDSPSQTASEFDLSLWPKCPSNPDLFGRKLTNIRWALYGTKDAPGGQVSLGMSGRGGAQHPAGGQPEPQMFTNSLIAAAAIAAAGGPAAFIPCLLGESWPGLTRLSAPTDHDIGELWVIYRKDLRRTARIKRVLSHLVSAAREDAHLFLGDAP